MARNFRSQKALVLGLIWGTLLFSESAFARCHTAIANRAPRAEVLDFFIQTAIQPVLDEGHRAQFAMIQKSSRGNSITIESRFKNTTYGIHRIRFTANPKEAYPQQGLPEVQVRGNIAHSEVVLYVEPDYSNLRRIQGLIRSLFRADPLLHPLLRPFAATGFRHSVPSYPQRRAISRLMELEFNNTENRALKSAVFGAPGMGKTLVVAKLTRQLGEYHQQMGTRGWAKKPKVLAVIENRMVLKGIARTFERENDFTKIARVYADKARADFNAETELITITRSSYFDRMMELHHLLAADPDQPWIIMVDEGQHAGKKEGQFEAILKDLETLIDGRHRIILPSATLWHQDSDIITDYLSGNIVSMMLEPDEQEKLQRGEELASLCLTDFFRSQEEGYLAPLYGVDLVQEIGGVSTASILSGGNVTSQTSQGLVPIFPGLLEDVATRIQRDRRKGVWDRGLIFVKTAAQANRYAEILTGLLKEEVRPFHSKEGVAADTEEWFADEKQHSGEASKKRHKYLVVVDKFREGVDVPAAQSRGVPEILWLIDERAFKSASEFGTSQSRRRFETRCTRL